MVSEACCQEVMLHQGHLLIYDRLHLRMPLLQIELHLQPLWVALQVIAANEDLLALFKVLHQSSAA